MVSIELNQLGKRYNFEWIFRRVDFQFSDTHKYVVLGSNGSGKSTFLQTLAGAIIPSEGTICYTINEKEISQEAIFHSLSYAAPYLELFEEFDLKECIDFQRQFKPFQAGLTTEKIIELSGLHKARNKQLKYYSSGMKQRVRLVLAILASTPILFLDEPTSNLDRTAIAWYQHLVEQFSANRLVIVASNQLEYEYPFCDQQIVIEDYKPIGKYSQTGISSSSAGVVN